MSVHDFTTNDLFVMRIIKSHVNNPADKWANSYEFRATDVGTESVLLQMAEILIAFEKENHFELVNFERFTLSTWEEDSKPYDPEVFISSTISGVGGVAAAAGVLSLETCLNVTRVAAFGRYGHIFWRGALDSTMVEAPSGKDILVDPTSLQSQIDDTLTSSGFADYIGVLPDGNPALVMVSKDGTQIRPVIGLFAAGVSKLPVDHAWFNRTTV